MKDELTVLVEGKRIGDWVDYNIECSMVEPTDSFELARPFDYEAHKLLRTDAEVQICLGGAPVLNGFVDKRSKKNKEIRITGRDRGGRLVTTSIPNPNGFDRLMMRELVQRISDPWFKEVLLSDAKNRNVRRGRGKKAAVGSEPAILAATGINDESAGRVDPGEMCWNVIEKLVSSVNLLVWSTADGKALVIGQPNYNQKPQYIFRMGKDFSTVEDLEIADDVGDSYAKIEVYGTAVASEDSDADAGDVICKGFALDGPNPDGTGKNFLRPKRMLLMQQGVTSSKEASIVAEREMRRRGYNMRTCQVMTRGHSQKLTANAEPVVFCPNTMARVIDEDTRHDGEWLVVSASFQGSRKNKTTKLSLVPKGTAFVS